VRRAFFAAALLSLPTTSHAGSLQSHAILDVGWNKHSTVDVDGGIFGAGLALRGGFLLGTVGADVTLQDDKSAGDSRYYMDTFSNGQSRCRDSETGQFVATEKCSDLSIETVPGVTAEGALVPSRSVPIYVGGGVYASSRETSPYFSFGYFGGVGEGRL